MRVYRTTSRQEVNSSVFRICYSVVRLGDNEPVDALYAHVLARAYWEAWRALHSHEPVGRHAIQDLDLAIDFAPSGSRKH